MKLTNRERFVIDRAKRAHLRHWTLGSDVGAQTKLSTDVCHEWQSSVLENARANDFEPEDFHIEEPLKGAEFRQRIDLVDIRSGTAYELKSSSNNLHHEFYRDVFKVLVFNSLADRKLEKLVFLAPATGIRRLRTPFVDRTIEISRAQDLRIKLVSIGTLHEAMDVEVRRGSSKGLSSSQLAAAVNLHELYFRSDGAPIPASQISARARKYPELFSRSDQGNIVRAQSR